MKAVKNGKIVFRVIDISEPANEKIAEKYEVMAVPTLVFFKDGRPVKRLIGYASQQEIEKYKNCSVKGCEACDKNKFCLD